ncbi:P-loop containing nucleoside triphosphate hydrolases superfamily protein [Prunus dulcis]|uniref:P-loop containing nucleoside triphosphate hydrolases superfamily protein n=1 Tax=Prunus dulcis TaxID=3755 RepID=A0A4Y1QZF6_PRUDU|nr:P-loop containing nucleoside triphosphate hydrolases superfamily protein [Prunus dulcis]
MQVLCLSKEIQTSAYEVVKGSYVPTALVKPESKPKDKSPENLEGVGAFQKLPMVMPSVDILYSALRKAKRISPTKGIANIAKRERNRGAKQLDALMKELAVPLRTYSENFPNKKYLHPYERSLIELTLGDGNYEEVLGKVDSLRKKVVSVGKEHASLCAKSLSKKEAEERLTEGIKKVEETFNRGGKHVDDLLHIAKTLRAMPVVDLESPTLCLVGAPNVGKSSLVRILSTGKPEVCNYPFTTRGILMGHIISNHQTFQVTDTPGLLKRCDEDRNNLEKLTLAVLSHLPTAILYVHDLSGQCGTSPSDQFVIYKEIKERFSEHLWLDVVSKCDLLQKSPVLFATDKGDDSDLELERYRKLGPDGALHVSVTNEVGLTELKRIVHEMLNSQMTRIQVQEKLEVLT